jgi:hypothetical protein
MQKRMGNAEPPASVVGYTYRLRPRLENQIDRPYSRTAHAAELTLFEHLGQPRLASLRPQREANLLGERRW